MGEKESSLKQDRERERASFAWDKVNQVPAGIRKDYKSVVNELPMQIRTNGLCPSLGSLIHKSDSERENAYWQVYSHLQEWLCDKRNICKTSSSSKHKLIHWLTAPETESSHCRYATIETLSLATWLKRFA